MGPWNQGMPVVRARQIQMFRRNWFDTWVLCLCIDLWGLHHLLRATQERLMMLLPSEMRSDGEELIFKGK